MQFPQRIVVAYFNLAIIGLIVRMPNTICFLPLTKLLKQLYIAKSIAVKNAGSAVTKKVGMVSNVASIKNLKKSIIIEIEED